MRLVAFWISALVLTVTCGTPSPAHADPPADRGFGVRAGFGVDPDQGVVGVQALLGRPLGIFRFAPNFDLGFGDQLTTYVLNADIQAAVPFPGSRSSVYAGAGPSLAAWDPDNGKGDLEIGLNVIAGIRFPFSGSHLYNIESRFGISDVPDFRLLVGVLFGSAPAPVGDRER